MQTWNCAVLCKIIVQDRYGDILHHPCLFPSPILVWFPILMSLFCPMFLSCMFSVVRESYGICEYTYVHSSRGNNLRSTIHGHLYVQTCLHPVKYSFSIATDCFSHQQTTLVLNCMIFVQVCNEVHCYKSAWSQRTIKAIPLIHQINTFRDRHP